MPVLIKPELKHTPGRILEAKTKDLGLGVVEVIVATGKMDRHGEKLDIASLNIKDYNGIVLLGHDYDGLAIGKCVYIKKDLANNQLIARTQFAIEEYPLAAIVYKLVAGGYMPDVSIGFLPGEYDFETDTWYKAEMIEYSHVTVGANKDAQVTAKALKDVGVTQKAFKEAVTEFEKLVKASKPGFITVPDELEDVQTKIEDAKPSQIIAEEQANGEEQTVHQDPPEVVPDQPAKAPAAAIPEGNITPDGEIALTKEGEDPEEQNKRLKSLVSSLEETVTEAKAIIAKLEVTDNGGLSRKKRKIVLVKAKASGRTLDRLAELFIAETKKK